MKPPPAMKMEWSQSSFALPSPYLDERPNTFELPLTLDSLEPRDSAVFQLTPGRYRLDIEVSRALPMPYLLTWNALLRVTFSDYLTGRQIFSRTVRQPGAPWWVPGRNGFSLLTYSVPEDLPEGVDLVCRIGVERTDPLMARFLESVRLLPKKVGRPGDDRMRFEPSANDRFDNYSA